MRRASMSVILVAHCVSLGALASLAPVLSSASVVAQTVTNQEPRIGTWRLNFEKSQFAKTITVTSATRPTRVWDKQ